MTVSFITTKTERELLKSEPAKLDSIHKIAVQRADGNRLEEESVTNEEASKK